MLDTNQVNLPKSQILPITTNLVELLITKAKTNANKRIYTFLQNGEDESATLTYRELDRQAKSIAIQLQKYKGERALLLYPSGLEFIAAFFGCLYAGIVAVPAYPPRRNQKLSRLLAVINDSQAKVALTSTSVLADIKKRWQDDSQLRQVRLIDTETITKTIQTNVQEFIPESVTPSDLAFLQYTSGSTGTPKGVMVTHENILHNQMLIKQAFGHSVNTVFVGWLPLFHDMGLIGNVLQPFYLGIPSILMPPVAFLMKPIRWLKAISKYMGTTSGGPNFAYDLCVQKIKPEELASLDLSSWDVAFNGAEPIRAETLRRFWEKFSGCGFKYTAFYPCYGMAETTLLATGGVKALKPTIRGVQGKALEKNRVVESEINWAGTRSLVGCGRPYRFDKKVVVVNLETQTRCKKGEVGEIWVSGKSVASGYWNRPDATQETFQAYLADTGEGPFLRTGDLGFKLNGELFITGRLKDVIIIRGRNYYPQDIELTVENCHPALRKNCSATFSAEIEDEERLLIVCEVKRTYLRKLNIDEIVREIRIAVSVENELEVDGVIFLKTGTIPKTSSGKIQRSACKQGFLEDTLTVVGQWIKTLEHNPTATVDSSLFFHSQDESLRNHTRTVVEIRRWLVSKIAELLQIPPQEIDVKQPLAIYGLNSVKAVSIAAELQEWLEISITPTIVYEYPTIQALSDYLGQTTSSQRFSASVVNTRTATTQIAIIGKGCRFPKANNPQAFWSLLREGKDGITKVPSTRWQSENSWGGFLEQVDQFDPQFFSIAPREATNMDPQQRLLLEVSWEALENAGLAAQELKGSQSGVFVGISSGDYARLKGNFTNTETYYGTGNASSIAANRLSYFFDWHGPSFAVDTACSSSLVAIHQACQSLLQGECDLALAGGVNLILTPQLTKTFSSAQMLAADGRCKTFDTEADGYVRSEGCGVIVLKRLEDALADGDNIQAIIRGSAINQDGQTNGLTAPNGQSQQEVIRRALAKAQVKPHEISYVEAHGTGTSLGDPIEVNSLKAVLMDGRKVEQPCWIGSVKTNIGHLEAAAGIAGIIKVILSLEYGEIPPHLHLKQLNPYIELDKTPIKIPTAIQPWPSTERPPLAGVSSFGFGGTNAHIILEAAPAQNKSHTSEEINQNDHLSRPLHLFSLSAKTQKALEALVSKYEAYLSNQPQSAIADICFTANTGRSHFNHRIAVTASDTQELANQLKTISLGKESSGVFSSRLSNHSQSPKIAFLFTGQGSQYINMGRQLYETQTIFRQTLNRCDEILSLYLDKSLLSILYPNADSEDITKVKTIDQTAYTQPALFALEYALAQVWLSWGIQPDIVVGHSVGEYVAATIAGIFSLEDGLKLIAYRGRLMQQLTAEGKMIAVMASLPKVHQLISPYRDKVSIAAINGSQSTVLSGAAEFVDKVKTNLESEGIKTKQLEVSHAFHSPLMEPMMKPFETVAHQITYHQPKIPVISNVTGTKADENIATASYWVNHIRQPVKFAQSMETLHKEGYEVFLEVGSKPILLGMGRQCYPSDLGLWLPSLRPQQADWQQMLQSLTKLYLRGVPVNWSGFDQDYPRSKVLLPTYPFQRQSYWIENEPNYQQKQYLSSETKSHPLLGTKVNCAGEQEIFASFVGEDSPAYLGDHRVFSTALFPTTGYLEIAAAASNYRWKTSIVVVENLNIYQALTLSSGKLSSLQTILRPLDETTCQFQIFSQDEQEEDKWKLHGTGTIKREEKPEEPTNINLEKYHGECSHSVDIDQHYQNCGRIGIEYGKSFQAITRLWSGLNQALAEIKLPQELTTQAVDYQFHPALLDAALQVVFQALPEQHNDKTYLPVGVEQFKIYGKPGLSLWVYASINQAMEKEQENLTAQVTLVSPEGELIAMLKGLQVKSVTRTALPLTETKSITDWLYEVEWRTKGLLGRLATAEFLPPKDIQEKLSPSLLKLVTHINDDNTSTITRRLDELSVDYIVHALLSMGWPYKLGETFNTESAAQRLGIVPSQRRLFKRLLQILAEVEILTLSQHQWQVQYPLKDINPSQQQHKLLREAPEETATLTLLDRCASQLSGVLRGAVDPVQLVFPSGDLSTATQLYQDSSAARVMNTIAQKVIKEAIEKLPPSRGVRLLEIGAGTGGTTSYIVPHLNPNQAEYWFTDLGTFFTGKAQQKFQEYPFLRYQTLDIEVDPETQGFKSHQYDVVIAANVLHATTDIKQTLSHVKQLLTPGGMLVLYETTTRTRWLDLVFGLLEGWWKFQDHDLRPDYPLLSRYQWEKALQDTGFSQIATLPEVEGMPTILSQQAVIVAQVPQTTEIPSSTQKGWLLFADQQGVAKQLAQQLNAQGDRCTLVFVGEKYQQIAPGEFTLNPNNPSEYQELIKTIAHQSSSLYGVVQCWSTEAGLGQTISTEDLENLSKLGCGTTLSLLQALVKEELSQLPRLWLVTSGSQPAPSHSPIIPGVVQSSLWGMGKVINLEHPELNCVRIDLDPQQTIQEQAQALFYEVWSEDKEDQVAWRGNSRYVPRLVPSYYQQEQQEQLIPSQPFRLGISQKGSLDSLTLEPVNRRSPEPGEVEIRVKATGLNFRDVLIALDIYPGEPIMGGDCAGEIVSVGSGITDFSIGDSVIAIAPGSFSSHVTVDVRLVASKPENLSREEAASIPINFLTAYYALHHLAKIQVGDKILIHAAAGGTGMAAVQIAQAAGAEVFATASPPKWEALRKMGIKHIMNSRTLEFADQVMSLTEDKGVNVVLNSLTSEEFVNKSLSVLSEQGRFVEIAKRGVWDSNQVANLRPDVSYSVVDLVRESQERPELIKTMLHQLTDKFANGSLQPPPLQTFPIEEVISAFRYMQQAKHIGKIIVTQTTQKPEKNRESSLNFHEDATYLITGGMGDLGLLVARWMVSKGAKNIVLVGRSLPGDTIKAKLTELEKAGAKVLVETADVSDMTSMTRVFNKIHNSKFPLAGVIHSAGTLSDAVLQNQTWSSFEKVMAPKVQGAWHLHQLTKNQPLDFFVLFSSAASLLGSPGQGNHSAANSFLDGLAHYRRGLGLPALSLHWGVVSEIGEAAERGADIRANKQGMGVISPTQVLDSLELLMSQTFGTEGNESTVEVGIIPILWSEWQEKATQWPFLSDWQQTCPKEVETDSSAFLSTLEAANPKERQSLLVAHVLRQLSVVLEINDLESIPLDTGFFDLGMDSLTSVEFRNKLQDSLGCSVPSTLALDYPTVGKLVDYLVQQLNLQIDCEDSSLSASRSDSTDNDSTEDLSELPNFSQLSEVELETSILQEIEALEKLI
ncbi:MAG: SDR family NAD(P)-dependent oxidoreductase [Crocosphaera sp.]|uniref:type I polyketide synthase n=1 Tax=Crocosphaera sp. TaxID=2729996 RepID=UPI002587173A|nr:type I polyketide synthase [Crocosphaera sp.]MCH2245137.1 SDR family NAD(P)-dependent oxidoreductase [Crocosphaera sp.]